MQGRTSATALLAAALIGCGGRSAPPPNRHLPAAIATPPNDAALLRVGRTNGVATLLRASTLTARAGTAIDGLPTISRLLGVSGAYDETVYAADNGGRLIAIDLRNQRVRTMTTTAKGFTATPDGTIFGVDSARHPVRLVNHALVTYRTTVERGTTLLRGPADQLLAIGNKPGTLEVLSPANELRHIAIPNGHVAGTWLGDLVAVTTDSGVVFVDPSGKPPARRAPPRFLKLRGTATVSAFSPSGHQLYVAQKSGPLVVVNRFTRLKTKEVPGLGVIDALRPDRSGRWLLAHGGAADSLWILDATQWTVVWRGTSSWSDDLPQVVDGHVLLRRRQNDVLAADLAAQTSSPSGALSGAANDFYVMLPWMSSAAPTTTVAKGAGSATDSAAPVAMTAPATDSNASGAKAGSIYLQISASQSAEWANALARQLTDGGYPAKVLEPKAPDDPFRVVMGPYPTRDEADSAGKRLGRPYFIMPAGSGGH